MALVSSLLMVPGSSHGPDKNGKGLGCDARGPLGKIVALAFPTSEDMAYGTCCLCPGCSGLILIITESHSFSTPIPQTLDHGIRDLRISLLPATTSADVGTLHLQADFKQAAQGSRTQEKYHIRGLKDHINIRISHSGSRAQYKGDTRNHGW